MMADNEIVNSRCDFNLKEAFRFEVSGALSRSVKTITSREYNLSFLGVGAGTGSATEAVEFDFVSANAVLLDFIKSKIDKSEYYVIFYELDEDYRDILSVDRRDGYFEILISLFKAVQNIRSELQDFNNRPVIFLSV